MGEPSGKKCNETKDFDAKNKISCDSDSRSCEKSADHPENKSENAAKTSNKSSSSDNISSLLSTAEKNIKELYGTITKKITDFMANDLQQLKNLSKDELTKLSASMSDYKLEVEKLSQEKLKRIGEMKSQLQTQIITNEEVKIFVKYFEERVARMKEITENIANSLGKSEVTHNWVTDLQTAITNYGKTMKITMNDLYNALKEMAGDVSRCVPDKETLASKIPKMPTTSEMKKMPSMVSKMFKRIGAGTTNFKASGETAKKVLLPVSRLREKLPTLNLGKHFNSNTFHGRANVAKATYVGVLLYYLYWRMKRSKS